MDNVLDVAALLEDAENRGGMLDHVDDLQDHNTQVSQERRQKRKQASPWQQRSPRVVTLKSLFCATAERAAGGGPEAGHREDI